MTALPPAKVGWCPGALRPMPTGDGLVFRVKPHGGVLSLANLEAIATLALRFGNGDLDLTSRANVQIRGVREADAEPLVRALAALGLLDANPDAEAVRNVVASPLAGLEHGAALDIRPITAAIERRLAEDRSLWRLPAKWSVVVDDGGAPSLSHVSADVRFEAAGDGTLRLGLVDDPHRAICAATEVADIIAELASFALAGEPRRMETVVRKRGAADLFAEAGLTSAHDVSQELPRIYAPDLVGVRRFGAASVLGVAPVFGALRAEHLLALVADARSRGVADIRLTPWRVLLLTGVTHAAAAALAQTVQPSTFIVAPGDPRLAIAACSGWPACHRATTPVRAHAAALASLRLPTQIHVSGCTKGCAHAQPAPWTLVGRDGRYDLVQNGKAGDAPLAPGLTFEAAARRLRHELSAASP